jgi:hypothetical protein
MNWDTHINNITSKANKIIGFLRRNLPIQNAEIKILASSANNLVFDVTATGRSFMNMRKSSGPKTDP